MLYVKGDNFAEYNKKRLSVRFQKGLYLMSPYKPRRPCRHSSCPELVDNKTGCYCAAHSGLNDLRGSAAQRGYDTQWVKTRQLFLIQYPLCNGCLPRVTPATLVHHKDRDPKNNDFNNLTALCIGCHAKEHSKDKKIY